LSDVRFGLDDLRPGGIVEMLDAFAGIRDQLAWTPPLHIADPVVSGTVEKRGHLFVDSA